MPEPPSVGEPLPAFFVFGSTSAYSRTMLRTAERSGCRVCRMPADALRFTRTAPAPVDEWAFEIQTALKEGTCVIAVIDQPGIAKAEYAGRLSAMTAAMVGEVLSSCPPCHLFIEGGATACAIVRQLGWDHFHVSHQEEAGVVEMHVTADPTQRLTVKPGSYPWPQTISDILLKGNSCAN